MGREAAHSLVFGAHGLNVDDGEVFVHEEYVQGDESVPHPEAEGLLALEDEDHAAVLVEGFPAHEALRPFLRGVCDFQVGRCRRRWSLQPGWSGLGSWLMGERFLSATTS